MAEEFEEIHMGDMNQKIESVMSTSDYAQVIFHDIAESYPVDVNVECKYTVTALLTPTKRDWIGVYKVGWTSSKEHIYYEWAPLPHNQELEKQFDNKIVFKANTLPGDDGEFYQFCYVTNSGNVRGASTPFQFRRPSVDEYVEIEDFDDDIMVIKSKTNALEDELGTVMKEKETLVKNKDQLENERESLLNKLVDTEKLLKQEKSQQETFKKQLKASKEKIGQLNNEAKDMLVVHDGLREKISRLSEEKMTMTKLQEEKESYTKSLREKVKCLINEKDSIMGKNKMLEEEKDLYKNHFTSSESTLQGHITEVDNLKKQLEKEEKHSSELQDHIMDLHKDIETMRLELAEQDKTNATYLIQIAELEEELQSSIEKVMALEECKVAFKNELEALSLAYEEVMVKWQDSKDEAHTLKGRVKQLELLGEDQAQKTADMDEQIQQLNKELTVKTQENQQLSEDSEKIKKRLDEMSHVKSQEEGPLFALRMAHDCLKSRLKKSEIDRADMEKDVLELVKKKNEWESREHEMKREIKDLKQRLLMGQEEYKEKYVECKKVYLELKKLQRQASTSRSSEGSPEKSSEVHSSSQTKIDMGNKATETDSKCETEQMTQTAIRVEKECHTQTNVAEIENHTQTPSFEGTETQTQTPSIEGAERQTQTQLIEKERQTQTPSVEGAEQQTQTSVSEEHRLTQTEMYEQELQDLADLTNPELQLQLDDLGRELEIRTAKKQKYKDQYQREKDKNAYLQKHYFEDVEKKNAEIVQMKDMIQEKIKRIDFLENQNRQLRDTGKTGEKILKPDVLEYPPQKQPPLQFQHHQNQQPPNPQHGTFVHYPVISPEGISGNPQSQVLGYPAQPFPVFFDSKPLFVYGGTLASGRSIGGEPVFTNKPEEAQTELKKLDVKAKNPAPVPAPVSPSVVEELDPLKTCQSAGSSGPLNSEEMMLPPPLVPERTPDAKVIQVRSYVTDQRNMEVPREENIERDGHIEVISTGAEGGIVQCCTGISFPLKKPEENPAIKPTVRDTDLSAPFYVVEPTDTKPSVPEPEENEERFFDAPETKECPVCQMTFPLNTAEEILNQHVNSHFNNTKDCPVCEKKYSSDTEPAIFEDHVQKHFTENPEGTGV